MNAVVQHIAPQGGALAQQGTKDRMAVAEVLSHVVTVQEVMRNVMKAEVHYGRIPGAGDKPTLLKPGAELLCMTFRVADSYTVEDLSTADMIRYRVTCVGTHQASGVVLGSGMGEASSSEEKYKWRKAICDEEWNDTPPHLRRTKYAKQKGGGFYTQKQVRTEPADIANTVLKMANKRAKIAMTLNVTAASDMFSQDLEDMDEALREQLARQEQAGEEQQPAQPPTWPDDAFERQFPKFTAALDKGKTLDEVVAWAETKGKLTPAQLTRLRAHKPGSADAAPTYAQVSDAITKAADSDALALAGDLIKSIPDEQQRKDLDRLYEQREAELMASA